MTFGNYDFRYFNNTNYMNGVQYRRGAASENSQEVGASNINSVNDDSIPEDVKKLNAILSRIESSENKVTEEDYDDIIKILFEMDFDCDTNDNFDVEDCNPKRNHYMLYRSNCEKRLCFTYNNGTDDITVLIQLIKSEDEKNNTEELEKISNHKKAYYNAPSSDTISQIITKIQDMLAGSKSDISTESILDLLEKNSCTNCKVSEDSYTSDESGDDLTYIKLSFELAGMKYNVDLPQDIKIYDKSTFINREFTTEELNNEFKGEPVTVSVNLDKLSDIFDTVVSQDGEPIFYALNQTSLDKLKKAGLSDEEINNMSIETLLVKLGAVKIEKTPIESLVENIRTQLNGGLSSSKAITQILKDNNCKNYDIKSERDDNGNINKIKATFTLYGKTYEIELNKDLNTYSSDTLSSLSKDNLDKYFAESVKKDGKAIMYSLNENAINKLKEAGLSANSEISEILAVLNGKEIEEVENNPSSENDKSENINDIISHLQEMLNNNVSGKDLVQEPSIYEKARIELIGSTISPDGIKITGLQLTKPNGPIYNIQLRKGNVIFDADYIKSTTVKLNEDAQYIIGKEELINKYFSVSVTKDGTDIFYYLNADGKAKLKEANISENDSMDKILQTLASGLTAEDVKILSFCSDNHSDNPIGALEELTKTEGITYTISNVSGDDITIKITNKNSGYSQDWTIRMTAENKSQISDIYIESVKNTLQEMLNKNVSGKDLVQEPSIYKKAHIELIGPAGSPNGIKITGLRMFEGAPSYNLVLTKGAVYINSSDIDDEEFKDENGQDIDKDIVISRYFNAAITDNNGNIKTYSLNNNALALLQSGTNHSINEIFNVLNSNISSVDKNIITLCNQLEKGNATISDLQKLVDNTATDSGEEKVSFSLEFIGNNKCKITITNEESGYSKSASIDVTEDNATVLKNLYLQKFVDNLQKLVDDDNIALKDKIQNPSVYNKCKINSLYDSNENFIGLKFTDLNINGDLCTIELKKGQTTYLAEDIAAVEDKAPRIFDYFDVVGTVKNSQGESENKFYVLNDKGKHLLGEPIPASISEIVNKITEKLSTAEGIVDNLVLHRLTYITENNGVFSLTDKGIDIFKNVSYYKITDNIITYYTSEGSQYTVDLSEFSNNFTIDAIYLSGNTSEELINKYFTSIASVEENGETTNLYYVLNKANIDNDLMKYLLETKFQNDILDGNQTQTLCTILTNYDQAVTAYNEFMESHTANSGDFRGHTPNGNKFTEYLNQLKKVAIDKVINADGEQNTQFNADDVKTALETEWKNIVNEHLVDAFKAVIKKPEGYDENTALVPEYNQSVKDWLENFVTETAGTEGDKVIDDIRSYLNAEFGIFFKSVNFDSLLSNAYIKAINAYSSAKEDSETALTIRFVFDTFCKALYETADTMTQTQFKNFKNQINTSEIKNVKFTNVSDIETAISNALNKTTHSKLYSSVQTALKSIFDDIDISKVKIAVTEGDTTSLKTILEYVYDITVNYVKTNLKDKGTSLTIEEVIDTFVKKLYETGISQKQKLDSTYGVLLPMYAWLQTGFPSNGPEFLGNEDPTKKLGSQDQMNWCTSSAQVDSAIGENGELRPLFDNIIDYIEKWFSDNGKQADYDTMFNNGKLAELITYVMKQTFTLKDGQSPYGIEIKDGKCYLGGFAKGFLQCFIDKMSNPDSALRAIITTINTNAGKYNSCHSSYTKIELENIIQTVINSLQENEKTGISAETYANQLTGNNKYFTIDNTNQKYKMKNNLANEYKTIEEFIKAFISPDGYYKENYLENDLKSVLGGLDDSQQSEITKLELNNDGTIKDIDNNAVWNQIKTNLTDVIYNYYPMLAKYIERTDATYNASMENLVFNIWNEVVDVIEQDSTKKFANEFKNKFRTVLEGGLTEIGKYTTAKKVSTTQGESQGDDPVTTYTIAQLKAILTDSNGELKWSSESADARIAEWISESETRYFSTSDGNNYTMNPHLVETFGSVVEFAKAYIDSGSYFHTYVTKDINSIKEGIIETLSTPDGLVEEQIEELSLADDGSIITNTPSNTSTIWNHIKTQVTDAIYQNYPVFAKYIAAENETYENKMENLVFNIWNEVVSELEQNTPANFITAFKAKLTTVFEGGWSKINEYTLKTTDKFSDHEEDIKALADSVDSFRISAPLAIGGTILVGGPLSSGHVDSIPGIVDKSLALASKFKIGTDDNFVGDLTIRNGIIDFANEFSNLLSTNNLLDLFKNDYGEHSVNKFILYMWNSTIGESVFMTYDQLVDKMKENLKAILRNPNTLFAVMDDLDNKISNCSTEADVKVGMTADEIKTKYHLNDKDIEILFNEIKDSNPKKYHVNTSSVFSSSYIQGFTGEETFAQALDKMMNNNVNAALLNKYGFNDSQIEKAFTVQTDGWYKLKTEFEQYNSLGAILEALNATEDPEDDGHEQSSSGTQSGLGTGGGLIDTPLESGADEGTDHQGRQAYTEIESP